MTHYEITLEFYSHRCDPHRVGSPGSFIRPGFFLVFRVSLRFSVLLSFKLKNVPIIVCVPLRVEGS